MLIELAAGYPQALVRAIGHPVTWIGTLIALLDRSLNRATDTPEHRRGAGIVAALIVCLIVGVVAFVVQRELVRLPFGIFLAALAASALIAQRSLHRHVADVALALEKDGLDAGRRAVARIVGRDTGVLDEAGVARAAIESLAENFSDGVVAPVLWMIIGGLPGAALYKAINTADSMIGHRTPRHEAFGWAAARLDDLINLPASRLSAVLIVAAAALSGDAAAGPLGKRWCAMHPSTARPMPVIRKPRWPARLAWRSRVRASTAASRLTMPRWGRGGAMRRRPIFAARSRSIVAPTQSCWRWSPRLPLFVSSREREQLLKIEMRGKVRGERVERAFDLILIGNGGWSG